ncbi:hypothetical protein GOP47_0020777 [Adiantum capillus-veneris]|uniref:Chorein N-terminal domain-containing protein n=1 Tax=Adiantum capillus-veneris TaxID=13818 RepID=A0A9D4UAK7_ADICA|nr:hypothetical protein GOP47_0020777 [Adiantum capillus-veneris]
MVLSFRKSLRVLGEDEDLNGEVLHASIGLPPTLLVSQARVGVLEIKVPPFSNVQTEPVIIEIDKLDLVLVEKSGSEPDTMQPEPPGVSSSAKSNSYGFADKIADGVTLQVGVVNLLLETRGGTVQEGASWTPPLSAITIRNLILYTTNEAWQMVNLKEARDFSIDKRCIYVFKKLEWDSLSVDLLPHPNMFSDERLTTTKVKTDGDGVKRLFFGGERFLDDISGKAFITMHRTEQNNPLGLEVQVCIPEATCFALSEPGLRALLRFMTGMYVCMNRGDVGPRSMQSGAEAAGRSMVQVEVEHIFLCIKDADFQLELRLQRLNYMRSSVTNGESTKTLARVSTGGLFLRDTFSDPQCTLLEPGRRAEKDEPLPIPSFASEKLWPRIFPITNSTSENASVPMLCMYSVQVVPSPAPPVLASQTVLQCQPLKLVIQEESCLRLASFLVDGVVVDHGVVIATTSVDSMYFFLKQLDLVVPVEATERNGEIPDNFSSQNFTGARLHVDDFVFVQSPSLSLKSLELDKDPACFMLWQGQPIDASQRRWVMRAMHLSVALETDILDATGGPLESDWSFGLWRCIEMTEPCIEAAMVTGDSEPIITVPPPGGIVRFGVHCKHLTSNTSVEQLFFVLRMYEHLGQVNDSLFKVTKTSKKPAAARVSSLRSLGSFSNMLEMAPSDTAVCLGLGLLELNFLESLSDKEGMQGPPLVQICGNGIELKVSHRTLGGAVAIDSKLVWKDVLVECVETSELSASSFEPPMDENFESRGILRPVFWIRDGKYEAGCNSRYHSSVTKNSPCFLDINVSNVIPYRPEDAECQSLRVIAVVSGIRLGGGIVYGEALLHRFGVLGPDGGPGKGLKRILKNLSNGPFSRLLRSTPQIAKQEDHVSGVADWEIGIPDAIEINIQLKDWVFALEADLGGVGDAYLRRERCWHTAFQCLSVTAQGGQEDLDGNNLSVLVKHPVKQIVVGIKGLEFIKPIAPDSSSTKPEVLNCAANDEPRNGPAMQNGLDVEVLFGLREEEEDADMHIRQWAIKRVKSGLTKPVEIEATKEDIEYLIETVRLEIESASRVAAGLMQLLELKGSIGQATIKQLSSIGSGSLDRIITPEKIGRRSSVGSVGSVPFIQSNLKEKSSLDMSLSKLEQLVMNSQGDCTMLSSKLVAGFSNSEEAFCQLSRLTEQLKEMEELIAMAKCQL